VVIRLIFYGKQHCLLTQTRIGFKGGKPWYCLITRYTYQFLEMTELDLKRNMEYEILVWSSLKILSG